MRPPSKFKSLWGDKIASNNFIQIPYYILASPKKLHDNIKPAHVTTLCYLLTLYSKRNNWPYPSVLIIAENLNIKEETARKYLYNLQNMNLIKITAQRKLKGGEIVRLASNVQTKGQGYQISNCYDLSPLIKRLENIGKEIKLEQTKEKD